jgi:hypothetical protein
MNCFYLPSSHLRVLGSSGAAQLKRLSSPLAASPVRSSDGNFSAGRVALRAGSNMKIELLSMNVLKTTCRIRPGRRIGDARVHTHRAQNDVPLLTQNLVARSIESDIEGLQDAGEQPVL